jgi:hypothetical protein
MKAARRARNVRSGRTSLAADEKKTFVLAAGGSSRRTDLRALAGGTQKDPGVARLSCVREADESRSVTSRSTP